MGFYADAFDEATLSHPAWGEKSAGALANLKNTFVTETRAAGPTLALMSNAPEAVKGYGALKSYNSALSAIPRYDASGLLIPTTARLQAAKRIRREAAENLGRSAGTIVGNLAGWVIPGGMITKVVGGVGLGVVGPRLGEQIARTIMR